MAARDVAAFHACDFERDHLIVKQRYDPADGPNEARAGLSPVQYIVFGHWMPGLPLGEIRPEYRSGPRPGAMLAELVIVAELVHAPIARLLASSRIRPRLCRPRKAAGL